MSTGSEDDEEAEPLSDELDSEEDTLLTAEESDEESDPPKRLQEANRGTSKATIRFETFFLIYIPTFCLSCLHYSTTAF